MKYHHTYPNRTNSSGLTLVELMVAVSLIAILSSITIFTVSSARESARDNQRLQDMQAIGGALQQFYTEHGRFPGEIEGIPITGEMIGVGGEIDRVLSPYLSAIPRDPLHDAGDTSTNPDPGSLYFYSYDPRHIVHNRDCEISNFPGPYDGANGVVYGFNYSETGIEDSITCHGVDMNQDDASFTRVLYPIAPRPGDFWEP